MLTVAEAAAAAHVDEKTIYAAIYRKRLPSEKAYGRVVLVDKAELEKYLAMKPKGRPVGSKKKQETAEQESNEG